MKTEKEIREMLTIVRFLGRRRKAIEALEWVLGEHPSVGETPRAAIDAARAEEK